MHLVPIAVAPAYDAPGHSGMAMRRLQGREAGPSDTVWIGLSLIEPGGGTTASASAVEKFYLVIDGDVEIVTEQDGRARTSMLSALDSCRIAPGESRRLRNAGDRPATLLLVMPHGQPHPNRH